MNEVKQITHLGQEAVLLQNSRFSAIVVPSVGGNIVSLRERNKQYQILREPESFEDLQTNSALVGMPVLFPPNRYEDGTFTLNGITYRFPVNEPKTGNHLHGFFHNISWEVAETKSSEEACSVTLAQEVNPQHPVFEFFPHTFTFTIRYALSEQGLSQEINIQNRGSEPMPCMLGFHTAINAPFSASSSRSDYSCTITIGERWELNERMLPTGQFQPLSEGEEQLKGNGINPFFEPMDNHYTAAPQNGRNCMELIDHKEKVKLVYDVGLKYKQWMVWNQHPSEAFFCPEPQINMVNAPNVNVPHSISSLVVLYPQEAWTETSRLSLENLSDAE